jgi:hypothetical protein
MKIAAAPKARPFLDHAECLMRGMGLPEGMGRVVSWLMICEPACQKPEEIAQVLGVPMGTVTAQLEQLLAAETVERVQLPEQSGACYALRSPQALIERRIRQMGELRGLLDEGLGLVGDDSPEVRERLSAFRAMYQRFDEVMREMVPQPSTGPSGPR